MHHLIFVLTSFISGVVCGTTVSTKADLLAVIRQDLRRNNDDYVESTISQQTLTSSTPSTPSITTQVFPVGTKNVKTTNNFETTKKPASPFRRVFISSEPLAIDKKPKHRPIKIDPAQFLMTMRNIPKTESKRQTGFTRTYKTNDMSRKNDLEQPDRNAFKQKTKPSIIWGKTEGSSNDQELKKIQAFMNELEKKDEVETEAARKSETGQSSKQELIVPTKTESQSTRKADQQQRMRMLMSKLELQEPWEIPRLETTRRRRNSSEMPIWRAIESKDTNKPINELQVVTNVNKNKAQASKLKGELMNVARTDTKLRHNYDQKQIADMKHKVHEGLKLSSLPPGDLLDLWPARGPMVHALRLRNRLCQRSVLLNEGPKYDSKGSTYQPRFKPRLYDKKKVVDFHQTKTPILVLPRCCNCCRKSVLGCE